MIKNSGSFKSGHFLFLPFLVFSAVVNAQFAPPAGQAGTTAVHKDSSAIVRWANNVEEFKRGAADIANGWGTLASFGDFTEALGYAQGNSTDVVSLGDSGYVTLAFPFPIMNGPGNDFAVFENSFSDDYLEFAHVEVSSDGINFIRIPSISLTQTAVQTDPFGNSVTEEVHNLAGKYRQGYGTPFDLEDIIDSTGINPDSILFVRVVDVIGSINASYGSFDSQGAIINDPYPTDFSAGGFDLDGVGVINENNIYAVAGEHSEVLISVFPNPCNGRFFIRSGEAEFDLSIYDFSGRMIFSKANCVDGNFEIFSGSGIYFVQIIAEAYQVVERVVVL